MEPRSLMRRESSAARRMRKPPSSRRHKPRCDRTRRFVPAKPTVYGTVGMITVFVTVWPNLIRKVVSVRIKQIINSPLILSGKEGRLCQHGSRCLVDQVRHRPAHSSRWLAERLSHIQKLSNTRALARDQEVATTSLSTPEE